MPNQANYGGVMSRVTVIGALAASARPRGLSITIQIGTPGGVGRKENVAVEHDASGRWLPATAMAHGI
jgi:hypothetical protein